MKSLLTALALMFSCVSSSQPVEQIIMNQAQESDYEKETPSPAAEQIRNLLDEKHCLGEYHPVFEFPYNNWEVKVRSPNNNPVRQLGYHLQTRATAGDSIHIYINDSVTPQSPALGDIELLSIENSNTRGELDQYVGPWGNTIHTYLRVEEGPDISFGTEEMYEKLSKLTLAMLKKHPRIASCAPDGYPW